MGILALAGAAVTLLALWALSQPLGYYAETNKLQIGDRVGHLVSGGCGTGTVNGIFWQPPPVSGWSGWAYSVDWDTPDCVDGGLYWEEQLQGI